MQTKGSFNELNLSSSLLVVGPESEWDIDSDQIFSNKHLNNTRNFKESEFGSRDFFQNVGSISIPTHVLTEDSDNSNRSSPTDSVAERYFLEFEAQNMFNRSNQNSQVPESFHRQLNGFHQQVARQQQHSLSNGFQQQNQSQNALQNQYGQPYSQQGFSKPRLQPTPHQMQYHQNQPQNNLNGGYHQQHHHHQEQQQQQSAPRKQQSPLVITPEYQQVMAKYQVPPSQYPIKGAVLSTKTSIPEPVYQQGSGRGGGGTNNKQLFQTQQQLQQFGSNLFQKQGGLSELSFPPVVNEDSIVFMVQFKMEFRYFVLSPLCFESVHMNSFVIVECDKGQDLGLVVELISLEMYIERRAKEQHSGLFDEHERVLRHVLKIANQFDLALLSEKFQDESVVVEHANEVVKRVLMLPMLIVNAEYQYDRTKLTIHYTANIRVDFRELVSKLYSIFRTTVWLKKVNPNLSFDVKHYAVLALRTGVLMAPSSPLFGNKSPKIGAVPTKQQGGVTQPSQWKPTPAVPKVTIEFSEEEVLAQYIPDDDDEEDEESLIFSVFN